MWKHVTVVMLGSSSVLEVENTEVVSITSWLYVCKLLAKSRG